MYLRKENLYVLAELMGYEDLHGLEYTERNFDNSYAEVLLDELLVSGMVQPIEEEKLRISDLGQFIINTAANPEICIHIESRNNQKLRTIYIKDYRYMYLDEIDNLISIDFLLNIDLIVGAIAEAIEISSGKEPDFTIEGNSGADTFTIEFCNSSEGFSIQNGESSIVNYNEVNCLNNVIDFIIQMMGKGEIYE